MKNFDKLVAKQEEQAKTGVEKLSAFKKMKTKAGRITAATTGSIAVGGAALTLFPAINQLASQNHAIVIAGIGALSILGSIKPGMNLVKYSAIIKELEKIKYRDDHIDLLRSYREHPTSLSGLNSDVASHFASSRRPFSIVNIDKYDIEDLQLMIDNIEKEAELEAMFGEAVETVQTEKESKGPIVKQQ